MKYEVWDNIIKHLFVLCGIRKMDKAEHAMYLTDMYAELNEKFTDQEIGIAARQIAENESLYGSYPPLSLWLKYAPSKRIQSHKDNQEITYIRGFLQDIILMDSMYFDAGQMDHIFEVKYGERGKFVLSEFGGARGLRNTLYKSTAYTQESVIKDFINAWSRSAIDIQMNTVAISNENTLKLEQK